MKPENRYIGNVHKFLPQNIHREKMANPYRGGTPDVYYEGPDDVLWAEYKYYPKLPPVVDLVDLAKSTNLSKLQQTWLDRAYGNGVQVAVILGWGSGRQQRGLIFRERSWTQQWAREDLLEDALTNEDMAHEIIRIIS